MEYINSKISDDLIKKILGNKDNQTNYLLDFNKHKPLSQIKFREISKGKNKGEQVLDLDSGEILEIIVKTWDYNLGKKIVRKLFTETEKYKNGKEADNVMSILVNEWKSLRLGELKWPFSQGAFDEFVQKINSEKSDGTAKDSKVKQAAVKYRRIKEINTVRNDFIETLIFERNENILPTLKHSKGVDFFINGVSYDQKVAKSPTKQFISKYKDQWKEYAIDNPKVVGKYLYTHQDEGRFDADPRLYVVYLDEDVSIKRIREIIQNTNLIQPLEVNFSYKHKVRGVKNYKVSCFVILLHK